MKMSIPWTVIIMMMFQVSGCRFASGPGTEADVIPQAMISNGQLDVRIYLPDTAAGYYRGARFDWSGVMPELHFDGHSYFGQWFETYDPYIHDAIMGPVNDFYPLGYDEGQPGEKYVKIGIGVFEKQDESPYSFSKPAQLINPGKWKIRRKDDQVTFTQTLEDAGYSFAYSKTVSLAKDRPVMVIAHQIENRGQKSIETTVYNHNFFVIDGQPTGPDFSVTFPFRLIGQFRRGGDIAGFEDNRIVLHEQLVPGQTIHGGNIEGFGDGPEDYDIRIENHKTGAGVRITCDRPLTRLVFWAAYAVISAEPYTHVLVEPAAQFSWTLTYEFYTIGNEQAFLSADQMVE